MRVLLHEAAHQDGGVQHQERRKDPRAAIASAHQQVGVAPSRAKAAMTERFPAERSKGSDKV